VGFCGARGSFYRAKVQEGRWCGEGNGRWRRCAFKAFNPSVMGGERRGEWRVKGEGKCSTVSGRGGVVRAVGACGGGGGSGARSGFRRKKTAELSYRVGPPISEGEATGRLGRKGREEVGHGWAGKEGRRSGRN
jgi:hypothetical protein